MDLHLSPALPAAIVALAVLALPRPALAQFQDCHDTYLELWVDPVSGIDPSDCFFDPCSPGTDPCDPAEALCRSAAKARAGDPTHPYLTLNQAVNGAWLALCSNPTFTNAIVHAMPGIYSSATNGERLPIIMRTGVQVQGAGAKETVIRGGGQVECYSPYFPWNPAGPTGKSPGREPAGILVDFTLTLEHGPCIDAFTFQGGDVQVYEETELGHKCGCVSNCVFDMRDYWHDEVTDAVIDGPYFGVLAVNIYFGEQGIAYFDTELKVLNDTFIQGWEATGPGGVPFVEVARVENVAVCNTNEPAPDCGFPPCLADPDPSQRGVGNLSVQNNAIRCLPGAPRTALLGIDAGDAHVSVGVPTGPSNAFARELIGGVSEGETFKSAIVGATPLPKVNLVPSVFPPAVDPAFVGEMLNNQFNTTESFAVRDWRILPTSALVNAGSRPADADPQDCDDGLLVAVNGTTYSGFGRLRVYDFDGEVHGNPRLVGANVDIGFDESDTLCVAGSYGNDSKSHNMPSAPPIPLGQLRRTYLFPDPGAPTTVTVLGRRVPFAPGVAWTNMPGTFLYPAVTASGLAWLKNAALILTVGPFSTTPILYTNPIDGAVHAFRVFRPSQTEPGLEYLSEQVLYPSFAPVLSNLQSEYF